MVVDDGTPGHLFAMCAAAPPGLRLTAPKRLYRYLVAQVAFSQAWALYEKKSDAAPFALVGLAPLDTGEVEAWFIVRPGGLPGHLLLRLVRFARQRLSAANAPAISLVIEGNSNGDRLAQLCGFGLSGDRLGSARVWRRAA